MGRRWLAAVAVTVGALVTTGCGASGDVTGGPPATGSNPLRIGPLTPRDADRITPDQRRAIADLAAAVSADAPGPAAHHMDGTDIATATTVALGAADQATFERQWAAAVGAVDDLDTPAELAAAGYVQAAVQGAGVGVHYVDWTLVDQPFDPARPAMVLVDERDGRHDVVGFSYWVHAPTPDGFAGPNDVWHQHTNLCIVNGWVDREMAATAEDCAGDFLGGADLWMLHAWVVPGHENRWGPFATFLPSLCPAAAGAPDVSRCPTG